MGNSVSLKGTVFTEPITCYFLDAILVVYCIVATALFFREKFPPISSGARGEADDTKDIYQELERPMDADAYQVLEPSKVKKKSNNKKKSGSSQAEENDKESSASLTLNGSSPPPRSPQ